MAMRTLKWAGGAAVAVATHGDDVLILRLKVEGDVGGEGNLTSVRDVKGVAGRVSFGEGDVGTVAGEGGDRPRRVAYCGVFGEGEGLSQLEVDDHGGRSVDARITLRPNSAVADGFGGVDFVVIEGAVAVVIDARLHEDAAVLAFFAANFEDDFACCGRGRGWRRRAAAVAATTTTSAGGEGEQCEGKGGGTDDGTDVDAHDSISSARCGRLTGRHGVVTFHWNMPAGVASSDAAHGSHLPGGRRPLAGTWRRQRMKRTVIGGESFCTGWPSRFVAGAKVV